jgi:crotonobetainyl-CoA:carnitine CoA-transferase CaiB-like acyl-CoA transferase
MLLLQTVEYRYASPLRAWAVPRGPTRDRPVKRSNACRRRAGAGRFFGRLSPFGGMRETRPHRVAPGEQAMSAAALPDIRVVEIAGHVAGPYAGSLLGDLGCDVIKVELPGSGDTHRGRNPLYEGYGPSFRALNRNKRSITVDVGHEDGREVLRRLLERADVLLENFRPVTRERLLLRYEDVSALNPRIVHCSITGYGQSGPYRDKPGFDTIGQALSGMLSLVTDADNPRVAGVSFTDHCTGAFAAYGVLGALLARERTGRGQFVDVSLLQVSLSFIESHIADFLNGGEIVSRDNFPRGRIFCFLAADRLPLVIHLSGHDTSWESLLKVVGREDLMDDSRFRTHRDRWERHWEIVELLAPEFARNPRDYWLAALDSRSLANAPIRRIDEVLRDPQVSHLGMPREVEHPRAGRTCLIGSGVNMSETPTAIFRPAPFLSEHTEVVLEELGFAADRIEELRRRGVV